MNARSIYEMREGRVQIEVKAPGITWGGVIAGSFVTAALSLVMLALGAGIGISTVPAWMGAGAPARVAIGTVVWMILAEVFAAGIGGYVAGRLRAEWSSLRTAEVHFRDRVQGFLVWAVSILITAAFLATGVTAIVAGAVTNAFSVSRTATVQNYGTSEYYADALFRGDATPVIRYDAGARAEANVILENAARHDYLPREDRAYLVKLVSSETGLNAADAETRVSQVASGEIQQSQVARKATVHSLEWEFVALLIGAFVASRAAMAGGKERDRFPTQAAV